MMKFLTICFLLLAATANAQPRPGAFTTLSTTGNITDGGLLLLTGSGNNTMTAANTGQQSLLIRNTTAGLGAQAALNLGNDISTALLSLQAYSSTFNATGPRFQNGTALFSTGAGSLSIISSTNSNLGLIRFYVGDGATEAMRMVPSSGVVIGGTTDPGAKNLGLDGGGQIVMTGVTFANLAGVTNGTMQFCTNCTVASNPCTGGGSGTMAFFQNSAWKCF